MLDALFLPLSTAESEVINQIFIPKAPRVDSQFPISASEMELVERRFIATVQFHKPLGMSITINNIALKIFFIPETELDKKHGMGIPIDIEHIPNIIAISSKDKNIQQMFKDYFPMNDKDDDFLFSYRHAPNQKSSSLTLSFNANEQELEKAVAKKLNIKLSHAKKHKCIIQ